MLPKELSRFKRYVYETNKKNHSVIRVYPRIVDKDLIGMSIRFRELNDHYNEEVDSKIRKTIRTLSHSRLVPRGDIWNGTLEIDYIGRHIDMHGVEKALAFVSEDMLDVMVGNKSIR